MRHHTWSGYRPLTSLSSPGVGVEPERTDALPVTEWMPMISSSTVAKRPMFLVIIDFGTIVALVTFLPGTRVPEIDCMTPVAVRQFDLQLIA